MTPDSDIGKALRYVGSYGHHEAAGDYQFGVLLDHGARRESRILEIGAGCLNLGHRLIALVGSERYVAIEPQRWLIDAGSAFFYIRAPIQSLGVLDFDAHAGLFDIIYSHSVLSHVSLRQLCQYVVAVKRQLALNGTALASLRFRDSTPDSDLGENDYPTISFFRRDTVRQAANAAGLAMRERPEIRAGFMVVTDGEHEHDWIELRHADVIAEAA